MTNTTPEHVIREYLSAARLVLTSQSVPGAVGWRAETSSGGLDARPETIHFIKMRSIAQRQVHVVAFETQADQRMRFTCCVRQDDTGMWHFAGGAGGTANGSPRHDHPWVNLGGGGWPQQFYAGGEVLDNGLDVVRVRLRSASGTEMEDTVDDGVVLFLTDDEVRMPVFAELFDRSGNVVGQHQAMG